MKFFQSEEMVDYDISRFTDKNPDRKIELEVQNKDT